MFESISQSQEKLKELNKDLQDNAKSLHDFWEQTWDAYLEGTDQVSNKFDDLINKYERINDELDFQKQLIQLLCDDEAYQLMSKYYEGQTYNTLTQMSSLKQQVDMWKELCEATMENQSDCTEDQKKYYEQWMDTQSDLNDLVLIILNY